MKHNNKNNQQKAQHLNGHMALTCLTVQTLTWHYQGSYQLKQNFF